MSRLSSSFNPLPYSGLYYNSCPINNCACYSVYAERSVAFGSKEINSLRDGRPGRKSPWALAHDAVSYPEKPMQGLDI